MTNPYQAIDQHILADAENSGAMAGSLFTLCDDIGPRFAGTDGYRRAAEFMLGRFQACPLDSAELEPFGLTAWRRGAPAQFTMRDPVTRSYDCYALPYSAATGEAGVTAGLVNVGAGSHEEMETNRNRIKGRLVLANGTGAHRTGIYAQCEAFGAAGLIIGNPMPGMGLYTGCGTGGQGGSLPAVSIGHESALQIARFAKAGESRFTLVTQATLEPATTWNVVGELVGREFPEERVIIGGHLDSHEIGPGAFDNATGAVLVMEVARLLARQRQHLRRTVRFIGFAAEEIGLLGSHYHARAHATDLSKARFMLNVDTPGLGRPPGLAFHKCPKAAPYVVQLAAQMGIEMTCRNREHRHSDHYPFILQGLPTAGIAGGSPVPAVEHFVHMAADTAEKIPLSDLRDTAAFIARFLLRVANDDQWPDMRRTAAEVGQWKV